MKVPSRLLTAGGSLSAALVVAGVVVAAPGAAEPAVPSAAEAVANATSAADALVAAHPAALHAGPRDVFVRRGVSSSNGTEYVSYDRTYGGLPVVGGDFVVATDTRGGVQYLSVAQDRTLGAVPTTATVTQARAESVAEGRLASVTKVEPSRLVIDLLGGKDGRAAWESTVDGTDRAGGPSRLTVYVDAATGAVLDTREHVAHGDGNSAYNGPNPVHIDTSRGGSGYVMQDPQISNLSCQDYSTGRVFTKASDSWGSGNAADKETGCVDALFATQTESRMLAQWLGRSGPDGSGGAWPIRMGLNDVNAYYDGTSVQIGHNQSGQWIPSIDVVAHEMGHGIDDHTPGSMSQGGTQEFVADTFGAATEWFANEPSPYDTPDFTVGEEINLVGSGPIRNMADPSRVNNDPDCYSSSVPGGEVHAAAGPGNHWFYLVAEGTNPANGQPQSPTCNGSSVTGVGVQKAITVMYNAMQLKTSASSYPAYRKWTLQAAKTLDPSCAVFTTVKNAWNAVSVPAQSGEATCTGGPTTTPPTTTTGGTTTPPTTTPPAGCGGVAAWSATQAYAPNDVVSYNGHKWTSKWYSTGAEPGAPGSWAVWGDDGPC